MPSFEAEKKRKLILVTGGAGFVGSRLIARLLTEGHRVISLDNYFTGTREAHVPGAEYREGHTRDIELYVPERPDMVYHFGEYSRVEKSFEDPIHTIWDLNIAGTFAVLEFCRKRGAKLIYAGSSTKFADGGEGKSQSPYAWSKSANTELVRNYGEWFKIPYAITYFYNVYGEGEIAGGPYATVVGIFKEKYKQGHPLTVVAPGTQLRNFTHIDDTVDGLILVGEKGKGDEYGIGNDAAYSVLDLANMFGGDVIMLPERRGNRMGGQVLSEKTRALGWEPKRSLESHVKEFIATHAGAPKVEKRVLVFSTTFAPVGGAAERALGDVVLAMPDVHFDIITSKFAPDLQDKEELLPNATVYRVGKGAPSDKYVLPFRGAAVARELMRKHRYIFMWSVLASYGALAATLSRRGNKEPLPLLITLADQRLPGVFSWRTIPLWLALRRADQVSTTSERQERDVSRAAARTNITLSNKKGDAFANQVRFLYNSLLKKYTV
jgi:UDP-glucose 4-epimerase